MGCAQAKPSRNSPAGGIHKLKLENGYYGISDHNARRRSLGHKRSVPKDDDDGGGGGAGKVSLSKAEGDGELVDGWPKWLTTNIPRHVLAGLVPKSVEAYDKLDKVVVFFSPKKSTACQLVIFGFL